MRSGASQSPAVSTRRIGHPRKSVCASTASRVVPGSSVTSARSVPRSALNSDDLPAFGRPARTSSAPSRSRSAAGADASSRSIRPAMPASSAATRAAGTGPSSSSGKSIAYASRPSASTRPCRSSASRRDSPPSSWPSAARACAGAVASIRSPTASACTRSSLPWSTARRVNSPGAAGRAPAAWSAVSSRAGASSPPWQESSTRSSPV